MARKYVPPGNFNQVDSKDDAKVMHLAKKLKQNNAFTEKISKEEFLNLFRSRKKTVVEILRMWLKNDFTVTK